MAKGFTVGMEIGNDKFVPFKYAKNKSFDDATYWADMLAVQYPQRRFCVLKFQGTMCI